MSSEPLQMMEVEGAAEGTRVLRLAGPLVLSGVFGFQAKMREDNSRVLILDFTDVPLVDSAGIGALVGAYVSRQHDGRRLALVAVNQRIHNALEVTRVESLFHFFSSIPEAEKGKE